MNKPETKGQKVLVPVGFSIIFFFFFLIIDFGYISPKVLPKDECYYHFNETPLWVDLLYMNGGSHGHPEWTFLHIGILLALSIFLAVKLSRKLRIEK